MCEVVPLLTEEQILLRADDLQQRQVSLFRHMIGHVENITNALAEIQEALEISKANQAENDATRRSHHTD